MIKKEENKMQISDKDFKSLFRCDHLLPFRSKSADKDLEDNELFMSYLDRVKQFIRENEYIYFGVTAPYLPHLIRRMWDAAPDEYKDDINIEFSCHYFCMLYVLPDMFEFLLKCAYCGIYTQERILNFTAEYLVGICNPKENDNYDQEGMICNQMPKSNHPDKVRVEKKYKELVEEKTNQIRETDNKL